MCDFVSWVEYSSKGILEILFLTDEEVFSSRGRETLIGTQDNDPLGHGAIRQFFNLGSFGFDHEIKDFWNLYKLPKKIAEKLKTPEDFDRNFGRMFRKFFQNDDLMFIAQSAPDAYRERAYEQLLKRTRLSDEDIVYILKYAPNIFKERLCEQLLKRTLPEYELRSIIKYAPESYKEKFKKLIRERCGGYTPGDKVRITEKPRCPQDSPTWVSEMDEFKGRILTLETYCGDGDWKTEETHWTFHTRWFKPIKK